MHGPGRIAFFLLLWWAVSLVACVRGDRYVADSHAAYNETLRARLDEELLLNLVRLRYRDRPLFLQVNSVIARFERSFGVSLSGYAGGDSASTSAERPTGYARGSIGGDVEFSETPTVTFTPLQGEDFAERLLARTQEAASRLPAGDEASH